MKKFSEFPQAATLSDNDLLLISQFDGVSAYETKYITANLAESVSKREFIARIDQAGITAPNITVIKDDFGDTYATVYNAVGDYDITGFNGELTGDEEIYLNTNNLPLTNFARTTPITANRINITTSDSTGTLQNGVLVYPTYIRVTKYL
jgi:hypothetical protein